MPRPIEYSRQALKALRKMDHATAARIEAKVEQLADDPESLAANVTVLKGAVAGSEEGAVRRLRVGDWRVIYRDGKILRLRRIAPRGAAYERMESI